MGNGTLITLMGEPNVNYDSKSSERENEGGKERHRVGSTRGI